MSNKDLTWDVIRDRGADHARRDASLASGEDAIGADADCCRRLVGERAADLPVAGIEAGQLIRLLRADQRDDADVRREVQRALTLDRFVPPSVGAQVQDGIVTLTGAVSRLGERHEAVLLAGVVPGVLGIVDKLVLTAGPPSVDDG